MDLEIGTILEGKVNSIMKFGAFVKLPNGKSGLVHISEITKTYVNDVNDHLTVGQAVQVKVIGITPDGKINLSIKQALAPTDFSDEKCPASGYAPRSRTASAKGRTEPIGIVNQSSGDASFEDKLKHFMQESDSRMSGNKLYADHRVNTRRRK